MPRTPRRRPLGRLRRPLLALAVAALTSTATPLAARADTVWYATGAGGSGLQADGTVLKVEGRELVWQTKNGDQRRQPMTSIVKVRADGETDLNAAEDAFEAGKFDVAAAAYNKAATGSKKDWVKDRAVGRLVQAAERAGQFPLSASAFLQLAARDPQAAAERKPAVPADKAQVAKAIPEVERAFNQKPTDVVRGFLGELYIANGEADKAAKMLSTAPGAAKNPVIILTQAKAALAGKNYAGAIDAVEQNRALFTDPNLQVEALHAVADALAALAGNDPAKKQDAAIAYMRVAAHFGSRGGPLVADALAKTGKLLEEVGQPTEAAAVYKQLAEDPRYKGTKAATDAQANFDRLSKQSAKS